MYRHTYTYGCSNSLGRKVCFILCCSMSGHMYVTATVGKEFQFRWGLYRTPPLRTKQSPFLSTLLAFPKQTFFHAGSCESLLWTCLCPFLDLSKIGGFCLEFPLVLEHGDCSADMSTYAWMFLSKWTLICSVRTNLCSLLVSLCDGVLINTSWFLEGEG